MNKHKKGGCSQARFQRLRKESIHAFFVKVTEELQKFADENIIIAGPGQAKYEFKKILPKNLQEKIIGVVDVDIGDEHDLLEESLHIMIEKEDEKKKRDATSFKKRDFKRWFGNPWHRCHSTGSKKWTGGGVVCRKRL